MKKLMVLLSLIGMNNLSFANTAPKMEECIPDPCIQSSYTYGGLGLGPLPIPALTLSLGRRMVVGDRVAIDAGVTLATLIRWNIIRGYVNGLCYINQKPCSQYYVGLGGSVGVPFGFDDIHEVGPFVVPNFLIGKEFYNSDGNKRFFQAEILYPAYAISEKELIDCIPFITLKYGFAF
ncbi:MAG: hypothetical protein K1000chlam3_01106 [Chlamydiae bacterium]|nr:hypothetical protein [Chlamydiota bacterium]